MAADSMLSLSFTIYCMFYACAPETNGTEPISNTTSTTISPILNDITTEKLIALANTTETNRADFHGIDTLNSSNSTEKGDSSLLHDAISGDFGNTTESSSLTTVSPTVDRSGEENSTQILSNNDTISSTEMPVDPTKLDETSVKSDSRSNEKNLDARGELNSEQHGDEITMASMPAPVRNSSGISDSAELEEITATPETLLNNSSDSVARDNKTEKTSVEEDSSIHSGGYSSGHSAANETHVEQDSEMNEENLMQNHITIDDSGMTSADEKNSSANDTGVPVDGVLEHVDETGSSKTLPAAGKIVPENGAITGDLITSHTTSDVHSTTVNTAEVLTTTTMTSLTGDLPIGEDNNSSGINSSIGPKSVNVPSVILSNNGSNSSNTTHKADTVTNKSEMPDVEVKTETESTNTAGSDEDDGKVNPALTHPSLNSNIEEIDLIATTEMPPAELPDDVDAHVTKSEGIQSYSQHTVNSGEDVAADYMEGIHNKNLSAKFDAEISPILTENGTNNAYKEPDFQQHGDNTTVTSPLTPMPTPADENTSSNVPSGSTTPVTSHADDLVTGTGDSIGTESDAENGTLYADPALDSSTIPLEVRPSPNSSNGEIDLATTQLPPLLLPEDSDAHMHKTEESTIRAVENEAADEMDDISNKSSEISDPNINTKVTSIPAEIETNITKGNRGESDPERHDADTTITNTLTSMASSADEDTDSNINSASAEPKEVTTTPTTLLNNILGSSDSVAKDNKIEETPVEEDLSIHSGGYSSGHSAANETHVEQDSKMNEENLMQNHITIDDSGMTSADEKNSSANDTGVPVDGVLEHVDETGSSKTLPAAGKIVPENGAITGDLITSHTTSDVHSTTVNTAEVLTTTTMTSLTGDLPIGEGNDSRGIDSSIGPKSVNVPSVILSNNGSNSSNTTHKADTVINKSEMPVEVTAETEPTNTAGSVEDGGKENPALTLSQSTTISPDVRREEIDLITTTELPPAELPEDVDADVNESEKRTVNSGTNTDEELKSEQDDDITTTASTLTPTAESTQTSVSKHTNSSSSISGSATEPEGITTPLPTPINNNLHLLKDNKTKNSVEDDSGMHSSGHIQADESSTIRGDIQNNEFSTSDETWEEIDGQVSSAPTDDPVTDNEYEVTALNSNILEVVSTTLPTILRGPDTPRSILPTPTAPTFTVSPSDVLYMLSESQQYRCGSIQDLPSGWSAIEMQDFSHSTFSSDVFPWED